MLRTSGSLQIEHLNSDRYLAESDNMTIVDSLAVNLSTSAWLDRALRDVVRVTMATDEVAPRRDPGAVSGHPGVTSPESADTMDGAPDFDGTTVLCQVCGDKASGFHYGVHSCEGCKGFFRRSIQQKIQYKACTKDENCAILRINRNRCQHCRLKKCLAVGMSRDAVRFGRVPKREKAAMLAAMQSVSEQYRQQSVLKQELLEPARLAELVASAHTDTCQFTAARVAPLLKTARQQPAYAYTAGQYACPLSPPETTADGEARHSQLFGPHIKAVVEFAKRLPGFLLLPEEDRVTLLKSSVFEVLLVWLAGTFDAETSTAVCLDGRLVRRDAFAAGSQPRFLLDSMFDFAAQLNSLQLTDAEVGLFCACVVLTTERPGLRDQEQIGRIQASLDATLREALLKSQPQNPQRHQQLTAKKHDLKTLNSLHADMVRSLRSPEGADGAWPACEGDTPAPTACSPASVSSGYVGSEEGRSPSPAVRSALKRPASDHCSEGAPTPSPCQSPVPGDRAPAGGDGGDQYMPLLKQALSLPALAEARAEPASLVPHKKFRWMRRESGCGEPPELEREEKLSGQPTCRTPTLSKILGAPPQRAWSSEQIRQRDAVARLLGMTTAAAEQADGAAATGQPLNLTTRPAGSADA